MRNLWLAMVALLALIASAPLAHSADDPTPKRQMEVRWSELGPLLTRGRITIVLPDGASVQGRTRSVEQEALVMKVSKSSDESSHPKGPASIPRNQITTIALRRTEGSGARVALTSAGFFGGIPLAMSTVGFSDAGRWEPVDSAAFALVAGATAAGVYGGLLLDRKTTLIRVLPD